MAKRKPVRRRASTKRGISVRIPGPLQGRIAHLEGAPRQDPATAVALGLDSAHSISKTAVIRKALTTDLGSLEDTEHLTRK